jgi:hypothetical protein
MSNVEPEQQNDGRRWSERHLDGMVEFLLTIAEPLGPLGAQVLWVAQPTLGLFMSRDRISKIARLLEQPDGLAQLRILLTGKDRHGE